MQIVITSFASVHTQNRTEIFRSTHFEASNKNRNYRMAHALRKIFTLAAIIVSSIFLLFCAVDFPAHHANAKYLTKKPKRVSAICTVVPAFTFIFILFYSFLCCWCFSAFSLVSIFGKFIGSVHGQVKWLPRTAATKIILVFHSFSFSILLVFMVVCGWFLCS